MRSRAYYNDSDPHCVEWLKNLIKAGAIPDGDVDGRSIRDVQPDDLRGYTQVHLFAGIGGWAYACRLAGWPDDREIWTASCPCQPFSVAGRQKGTGDDRHLWPDAYRLHSALRPPVLMGEQVASPLGRDWFTGVRADLERTENEVRGILVPACAVSAPIERMRLWFVASAKSVPKRKPDNSDGPVARERARDTAGRVGCRHGSRDVAGPDSERRAEARQRELETGRQRNDSHRKDDGRDDWLEQLFGTGVLGSPAGVTCPEREGERSDVLKECQAATGASGDFWGRSEWIPCADGKLRRLEPGIALLAHGLRPKDVAGELAGFGNAINPWVAKEIIQAFEETCPR